MKSKTIKFPPRISAARFAKMSPASQRRAIARDILFRLSARQLKPTNKVFVRTWRDDMEIAGRTETDLQALLHRGKRCEVCALGGAICGLAHFEDKIRMQSLIGSEFRTDVRPHDNSSKQDAATRRLIKIFGRDQLAMMEYAFEGGRGVYNGFNLPGEANEKRQRLMDFYYRFDRRRNPARARFRTIWTRVARHPDGRFEV